MPEQGEAERSATEEKAAALELRGVSRRAERGDGKLLLKSVDLTVSRGRIVSIVGPSGAGKSTLLRLLNRLDESAGGEISVLGRPIAAWPVPELRRRAALVFQEPSLLGLTVRENLALPFKLAGRLPPDPPGRMREALERMELESGLLDRGADGLSVGQKQRVCLARALMGEPEILLLDEPTSGLDPRLAERLLDRLAELNREKDLTLVIATHRFEEVRRMGGRVAVLLDGTVKAEGPAGELLDHPPSPEVKGFLRQTPQPRKHAEHIEPAENAENAEKAEPGTGHASPSPSSGGGER